MNSKFSHLIRAGAIIHTASGGMFCCTSKIASSEGIRFRLSNLQGKPVPTPANFRPISHSQARFAAWMRLAYNKDFDMYVKAYIHAAVLPVDNAMNWSRFFQAKIAPRLMSKDPEVQDEAIHHIIIKSLVDNQALLNFNSAIKKFPPHIQELPLEKQVTRFLMQTFNWRVDAANEYIKNYIFQDGTSSMWTEGDEEGGDINLLDNAESATGSHGYDKVDTDVDVDNFRKGFAVYLDEKFRTETVEQYLSLFDLLYAHMREGDLPRGVEIYAEWVEGVGEGKSASWFKVLFANLPKIIDTYIIKHLKGEEVSPFIDIMRELGKDHKEKAPVLQPVIMGGLKLAEEFPTNHNIEPESSSTGGGSGFGGSVPTGEISAPAEAAGLGELAEVAPMVALASKKKAVGDSGNSDNVAYDDGYKAGQADRSQGKESLKVNNAPGASDYSRNYCQGYYDGHNNLSARLPFPGMAPIYRRGAQWEVPKCKACGKDGDRDCLACQDKFCGDCILNHHANNPSHERLS